MSNIIFRIPPEFTISTAKFFLKEVENVFKWNGKQSFRFSHEILEFT